jgi:DNA-binding CsgD family transcriptional regulator
MKLAEALLASDALSVESASNRLEQWGPEWGLTKREQDAARLVARGFRNAEIASLLRISPNTVRNHIVSAFRKADVSTRAELVFAMTSSDPGVDARSRRGRRGEPWSARLSEPGRRRPPSS